MFKDGLELMRWLENAMGDIADCEMQMPSDKSKVYMTKLRMEGVEKLYLKEALADELYNDVDTLVDMIGDQIYGLDNREELLDYCLEHGHTALKQASNELRE